MKIQQGYLDVHLSTFLHSEVSVLRGTTDVNKLNSNNLLLLSLFVNEGCDYIITELNGLYALQESMKLLPRYKRNQEYGAVLGG